MAVQEARYICDRCGMTSTYLKAVFESDAYGKDRLCEPCLVLFKKQYRLWCNDSKPISVVPVKDGPFRVRKSWWK